MAVVEMSLCEDQATFSSSVRARVALLTGFFFPALPIATSTALPIALSVTPFLMAFLTAFSTFFCRLLLTLIVRHISSQSFTAVRQSFLLIFSQLF
jgi:hypothetical protein